MILLGHAYWDYSGVRQGDICVFSGGWTFMGASLDLWRSGFLFGFKETDFAISLKWHYKSNIVEGFNKM